jgi:Cu-processing system permease protein
VRNLAIIVGTVWIEFLRRKDFYVVLMFMGPFALAALVAAVVGVKTAAEAEFLMSFGLSLAWLLSALLTASLASRQLPREFENRTLYPLLARPVSRAAFLFGKVAGVAALGVLTLSLLTFLGYAPTPKSSEQSLLALAQILLLQSLALALLAVLAAALSLYTPPVVAMLLSAGVFLFGGSFVNAFAFALNDAPAPLRILAERLLMPVPDFSVFNHVARFAGGHAPIDTPAMLNIAAYAAILGLAWYAFAAWTFARRQL